MERVMPGVMYAVPFEEEESMETELREPQKMEGFPLRPQKNYAYVLELGVPDKSPGGIYFGSEAMLGLKERRFGRYQSSEERYGVVVAIGPGKLRYSKAIREFILDPPPEVELDDVVMFSRKHGSRFHADLRFEVERFKDVSLNIRALDPSQVMAVCDDFEPWWDVEEARQDPDGVMTG